MSARILYPHAQAQSDADEAAVRYLLEAGEQVAAGFMQALDEAYRHIARYPASGAPRYAHDLAIAGLRFWRVKQYPYLVFYMETSDCIEVLRVLHGQQDIPASLQDAGK